MYNFDESISFNREASRDGPRALVKCFDSEKNRVRHSLRNIFRIQIKLYCLHLELEQFLNVKNNVLIICNQILIDKNNISYS